MSPQVSLNYHFLNPWAAITIKVNEKSHFAGERIKRLTLHTENEEKFSVHQKI